ncbi:hypothetical protein ABICBIBUN_04379 [Acinetobacter baumannii 107m]|nr:hypothetical protein ABICBIBUN_04379 [Acinetobacter baumannii 107m]
MESGVGRMTMDVDLELKAFIEAMKKNGCPMWMFERDEDGNFEDMTMAHSWYAWQEKAKAQAVPEDWVIVPQELPLDMALKIAKERIIEQPPVKDPVLNEILEKALKENLQYEQCRLIRDYKEMVKRLSESGADYE